ncbi:hypothetical protein DV737_g465, partial [Chaetothyriales sp. CBS 132003]
MGDKKRPALNLNRRARAAEFNYQVTPFRSFAGPARTHSPGVGYLHLHATVGTVPTTEYLTRPSAWDPVGRGHFQCMNGISEPLPGLLDDPQFQLPDLPALTDFHIAPLRDPAPPRHLNAPLPLEPVTENAINSGRGSRPTPQTEPAEPKKTPLITPSDVLQARESKKPHLAISEIIEHNDGPEAPPVQLPSFVSLSVVEKSPVPASLAITAATHASRRPRLDQEADTAAAHEFGRQLPRPPHKEHFLSRPAPLLPAMVTGLHEPPPSAGLLPSIDLDQPPAAARKATAKIQVKDILMDVDDSKTLSAKVPTLPPPPREPAGAGPLSKEDAPPVEPAVPPRSLDKRPEAQAKGDSKDGHVKARRARRPWTEAEAQDLLRGVGKHGVGRWKQILEDPSFHFNDRTTVDLKDRHRVSMKEKDGPAPAAADSPAARRAWTPGEDERLIKGIQKHGFQWTNIHDDPNLDLAHRRATDLRDRIRNKYPEGYRRADLTLDDDNDAMDWDNTLPPLLEWDDLGNMGV